MVRQYNVCKDFDEYYNEAFSAWDPFIQEAQVDLDFYLGNQFTASARAELNGEGRSALVFNRIQRVINMLTGYQRKHRLSSIVTPIESSDQKTADQLSQLLLYVMQYGNGYQTISDCFGGALKTGFNLMSIWMDYTSDPVNGDLCFGRESFKNFLCDPYFTKLNFSDCGYILRRKYLSEQQVISLVPKHKKEIKELAKYGWERDSQFTWLPYQRIWNGQEMMAYNEIWTQGWKSSEVLVDTETGEFIDWEKGSNEKFQDLKLIYPQLELIKKQKPYVNRKIIINGEFIEEEDNPDGLDEYPFVPFVATFEPESDNWELRMQSKVRPLRDPQIEANTRRNQMVDIIRSQTNTGWVATEGSVVNKESLFQSGQGKVIWRSADAPPGALERLQPAQVPPSMFQLTELYDRDILEIAGINDAAMGQADSAQESGVLALMRQSAALVNCQDLFDNLRYSQKMISGKACKLIQTWTPAKVKRIINQEPTEEFYSKNFSKYDCVIQEGLLTDTQRQLFFRQLVDLKALGEPIPPMVLTKAAPLQGKSELIAEIEAYQKQQQQAAQKQQQDQQQFLQTQADYNKAKSISELANAKEHFTRSVANLGLEDERVSSAVEDRANATLLRAKAIKELQSLDDDRLLKYLSFIQVMEANSKRKEDEIKEDDVRLADVAEQSSLPQQAPPLQSAMGNLNQMEAPYGQI
jgi:hypothetical protein